MPDKSLILNDKIISYEEIKEGIALGKTDFEQSTLTICRQWLNGQATFSLKTSGSTGSPKEINVSREQMKLSAAQTIDYFNLSSAHTVLVCLNTASIAGIMMVVRALESGAKIIAVEPSGNPLQDINQQIDFVAVVPLQIQQILNNAKTRNQLKNCRAVIVGGAQVSIALANSIKESAANIYATFGMTETLTHFAIKQLSPVQQNHFTALDGVIIGQDNRGCLTVVSAVTKQKLLITNDVIELLSANSFKWLGRIDNVINSGGVKLQIEALEVKVEATFNDLGITNRFFITPTPDEQLGEKVTLVIESDINLASLKSPDWGKYFTKYEMPKKILFCDKFQQTLTGKINRVQTLKNI